MKLQQPVAQVLPFLFRIDMLTVGLASDLLLPCHMHIRKLGLLGLVIGICVGGIAVLVFILICAALIV